MSICLRPTQESDLHFVLNAEYAEENRPFIHPWAYEQHAQALTNQDFAHLIIETSIGHQPVGYIILADLESSNQSVEFRRIVVADKGKGYGRAAIRLLKKMAFEDLHTHRLWLDVKEHNVRARQLYESEGFIVEGTLRESLKTDDKFESLVILSMLRSEYKA